MQALQNLGLAVISMVAGMIVDDNGYLWLEVFFCAWLCASLMCSVLLFFIDAAGDGALNLSAAQREALESEEEKKSLLTNAEQEEVTVLPPSTAQQIRMRYLQRLNFKVSKDQTIALRRSAGIGLK